MVAGSAGGDENLTDAVLRKAERVGALIAERDGILICGGLTGVMEAAARGAKSRGGLTVGILPRGKEEANPYIDVPIATQMGYMRNNILVQSADSVIAICGRWGTLNEVSFSLIAGKPTIVLAETGGVADILAHEVDLAVLKRKPVFAATPEEAVALAFPEVDRVL